MRQDLVAVPVQWRTFDVRDGCRDTASFLAPFALAGRLLAGPFSGAPG